MQTTPLSSSMNWRSKPPASWMHSIAASRHACNTMGFPQRGHPDDNQRLDLSLEARTWIAGKPSTPPRLSSSRPLIMQKAVTIERRSARCVWPPSSNSRAVSWTNATSGARITSCVNCGWMGRVGGCTELADAECGNAHRVKRCASGVEDGQGGAERAVTVRRSCEGGGAAHDGGVGDEVIAKELVPHARVILEQVEVHTADLPLGVV